MADRIDVQGMWWLPEDKEHKVAGWFTWDQDTGGDLRLQGQLRPARWDDNVLPDGTVQKVRRGRTRTRSELTYPIVHGQVNRKAFTLLDCFSTNVTNHFPSDSTTEKVHVDRVLEAPVLFTDYDDLRFDRSHIAVRHLTGWVGLSGLSRPSEARAPGSDNLFSVLEAAFLPRLEARHGEGSVSLSQSLRETGDHVHTIGVEQTWALMFKYPTARPLDSLIDTASDIQDLVSIAVGLTADFEGVTFEHPDIPLLSLAGTQIGDSRAQVNYYARWSNRSDNPEPVKRHDMYFSFEAFGGIEGIGRWLTVAKNYRTELGRVMATRYSRSMYLEDRIMNVCAALESFDTVRRSTGREKVNFVDHIMESMAFAGKPFGDLLTTNPDEWARKAKNLRHDLAHHRERLRMNTSDAAYGMSEQLFWLFALCMLRLAEAPEAVYVSIANHANFRWLIELATEDTAL